MGCSKRSLALVQSDAFSMASSNSILRSVLWDVNMVHGKQGLLLEQVWEMKNSVGFFSAGCLIGFNIQCENSERGS